MEALENSLQEIKESSCQQARPQLLKPQFQIHCMREMLTAGYSRKSRKQQAKEGGTRLYYLTSTFFKKSLETSPLNLGKQLMGGLLLQD